MWVHVHSSTFAAVPTDMAIHQCLRSILFSCFYSGWVNVAPQDESCRYCYDLCRELRLFSLRAIWYMYTLCKFTVVPTNIGEYHVSVKHTKVSILHCCFSVLVHNRPTLPLCKFVPNLEFCLARRISEIRCRHLECAIMIDNRTGHRRLSYLSVLAVTGSRMSTTSAVCDS